MITNSCCGQFGQETHVRLPYIGDGQQKLETHDLSCISRDQLGPKTYCSPDMGGGQLRLETHGLSCICSGQLGIETSVGLAYIGSGHYDILHSCDLS